MLIILIPENHSPLVSPFITASRLLSLSHRFRTCLKMADSSDANLVGNLFFNVVKTKCFVLKPEKYCKQYNYMKRKCEKKGIRKRAYLRDNREF